MSINIGNNKKINAVMTSINGNVKNIKSIYIGVNGISKLVWNKSNETPGGDITDNGYRFVVLTNGLGYDNRYDNNRVRVLSSPDGINWKIIGKLPTTMLYVDTFLYQNGKFIIAKSPSTNGAAVLVYSSEDLENWNYYDGSLGTISSDKTGTTKFTFYCGLGKFFAKYTPKTSYNYLNYASIDGITWDIFNVYNNPTLLQKPSFSTEDMFVYYDISTLTGSTEVKYSLDGINYVNNSGLPSHNSFLIYYYNGIFYAFGTNNNMIYYTDDLKTNVWNQAAITSPISNIKYAVISDDKIIISGYESNQSLAPTTYHIYYTNKSLNTEWNEIIEFQGKIVEKMMYCNGTYMIIFNDYLTSKAYYISRDAISWYRPLLDQTFTNNNMQILKTGGVIQ